MDPLASNQIKTAAVKGGGLKLTSTANLGVKQQVQKQEAVARPSVEAPKVLKENGVSTSTTPEGFRSQKADSGLSVLTTDSGQQITLPSGHSFELTDAGLRPLDEDSSHGASLTKTADDLLLISFKDKDGNTVQVQPDSLTYEVLGKNISQVFHPDGHQEVVAFGHRHADDRKKITAYESRVLYSPDGEMVGSEGFKDLSVDGKKLSFDLGDGIRRERSLARPLPGQPAFEQAPPATSSPSGGGVGVSPLTIFGSEPLLDTGTLGMGTGLDAPAQTAPAVGSLPVVETPAGKTAEVTPGPQEAAEPVPFQGLTDISKDFFANPEQPGVSFDETLSGLVMRQEGNSRAFLLPNGDQFRTDGKHLEVLGETPRAKNARIVTEGEAQLLAYSDVDGNRHTLDINTGDYEVSNRQGTLTQGLKADGTKEYAARGTYTSESGKPQQYFNKATFGAAGTLLTKEGFDDLHISGDKMSFTLPNGVETDRTLVQPADQAISVAKKLVVTGGFADEWGSSLALADELLNPMAAPAAAANAPNVSANPQAQGPRRAPGVVRMPLPDGGSVSTLPNGIRITDGKEISATDPMGNPLSVQKSQLASDAGDSYLLTVHSPDGVGYTIGNTNLDMIVQSPDGKVHQLVGPSGKILTSILDNGNQHMLEIDPFKGTTASPGTRVDPRFPDRVFIDGPQGGYSYQVPHPFGPPPMPPRGDQMPPTGQVPDSDLGPNGQDPSAPESSRGHMAGPGGTAEGIRPSFWQRLKGAFTGENPWDPNAVNNNGFDQRSLYGSSRYAGSYQQYDPMTAQMAQMERMNRTMMWGNVAMGVMSQMSMMSMMFYPRMGF